MTLRIVLCVLVALVSVARADAADRYVCAAGDSTCGGSNNYTTVALALSAASCGDTIFLKVGETHTASTTLTDKSCTASLNTSTGAISGNPITIRSAGSDINFPAVGQRIGPAYASVLATVKSGSSDAAFKTASSASGYVIKFLKFEANDSGFNTIFTIGANDSTQQLLSQQPEDFIIDRVWMTGDSLDGQKRGLDLNGADIWVVNSYIEQMMAVGSDSQALAAFNGTGPITILNNYIEGAGYGYINGGAVPAMRTCATVKASPAPTTTQFELENFKGTVDNDCDGQASAASATDHSISTLSVGQNVAVQVGANAREWGTVTAIASNVITIDTDPNTVGNQGLSTPPSTGHDVRWGYQPNNVTFKRNYVYKRPSWKAPILSTPGNVVAGELLTGGTLAAGTYCYRVVAFATGGENQTINSAATAEKCATLTSTGSMVISWSAVTNAVTYRVYRIGATTRYFTATAPTVTLTDTGSAGTVANFPSSGTHWQVKNAFEWKFGDDGLVEDNIFDGSWQGADNGPGIWLKGASNQPINATTGGRGEFITGDDFIFRRNVIRRVPGCFQLVGHEAEPFSSALDRPKPGANWLIEENLCYDSGSIHNYPAGKDNQSAIAISNGFRGITIKNNTFIHNQQKAVYCHGRVLTLTNTIVNNLFAHGSFGVLKDAGASGVPGWVACGGTTFTNNTMAGGTSSLYPSNLVPTVSAWQAAFVNYGGANITDYALVTGHAFRTGGTTGGLIGADIAALNTALAGVIEGVSATAPIFITTALADGTVGTPYSATIATSGGTGSRTLARTAGSFPAGISMNSSGVFTGTPTADGTSSFVITVTDSAAVSTSQTFTLTVAAAATPVSITTTSLPNATTTTSYNETLSASGGTGGYVWTIASGLLPSGWSLSPSGVITGMASTTGPFSFVVRVSSGALTATQGYSLTVTASGTGGPEVPLDPYPRPRKWNGHELYTFKREDCKDLVTTDRARVGDLCVEGTKVYLVQETSPEVVLQIVSGVLRESFDQGYFIMENDATAKSVTDNAINVVFGSPVGIIHYHEEVTKTASSWTINDGVLDIDGDNDADNEGVEIRLGSPTTTEGFIVAQTSGACFAVNLRLGDISGTDQLLIGWVQNEAFNATNTYASYNDWSLVGVNATDGSIFSLAEVAGGGTLSDDSEVNMADGETRTFKSCILADGTRTASYTDDGGSDFTDITLANGVTAHTSGDQMFPMITFLSAGTDGADVTINWMEVWRLP